VTLQYPRPSAEVVEGGTRPFSKAWGRFLRDIWSALGYNHDDPIFNGLFLGFADLDNTSAVPLATIDGRISTLSFDSSTFHGTGFSFRLPNDYLDGTDLKPYIVWAPADATSGTVVWYLDHLYAAVGGVLPSSTTESVTVDAPETSEELARKDMTDIPGSTFVRGGIVTGKVSRDGTSDTYANNALLLGVGFEYQIQGNGSRNAHP
jgi:hypothetical protein